MLVSILYALLASTARTLACESCYGPENNVIHTRNVRRMQPDAEGATVGPRGPLEWGQINFLHTTDTHGWLEGHLKEQNYGADWGDFVSFTRHMRHKAGSLRVDLLLIDTGDLHDGAGLSDATTPNGNISNAIFENVDYDLLTIGNHELYLTDIAYETFSQFSKVYGERYLTSNVQIINPATGKFEYIGAKYRYFTTEHGLRIMAFGVLFDFRGNSNVSKVIRAADLVKESWFLEAVNYKDPIDLFVVTGHNPTRPSTSASTFGTIYKTIRGLRPETPIEFFGGHTHIRDFVVFDGISTGIESGRYCETLGWVSMSGINSTSFKGNVNPRGVPNPTMKAVKIARSTGSVTASSASATGTTRSNSSSASILYSRRYLDWNRVTFAFHAIGSQDGDKYFDYPSGERVTTEITTARKKLNLTAVYGCAPATYCQSCKPFGAEGNIFGLLPIALSTVVVNQSRADTPRLILINTGSIRFDLVKGPFSYDDSFIVSPFKDAFQYLQGVPYTSASRVLDILNKAPDTKKRGFSSRDNEFATFPQDSCVDPLIGNIVSHGHLQSRSNYGITRRQTSELTPGYVTTDDFGVGTGDDTPHSKIPNYRQPDYLQANASFPADKSVPTSVDLIFLDYIAPDVLSTLKSIGSSYTTADVSYYLPPSFTTNSYLPAYARIAWQANITTCPAGVGVGTAD